MRASPSSEGANKPPVGADGTVFLSACRCLGVDRGEVGAIALEVAPPTPTKSKVRDKNSVTFIIKERIKDNKEKTGDRACQFPYRTLTRIATSRNLGFGFGNKICLWWLSARSLFPDRYGLLPRQ